MVFIKQQWTHWQRRLMLGVATLTFTSAFDLKSGCGYSKRALSGWVGWVHIALVHLAFMSVTKENSHELGREGHWGTKARNDPQRGPGLTAELGKCTWLKKPFTWGSWSNVLGCPSPEAAGAACWNVLGHRKRCKPFGGTKHSCPFHGKVVCNSCLIYSLGLYGKFIFTRVPEFTRTSLNGTHDTHTHTHKGKSLWQFAGNKVYSVPLYNKWTLMIAKLPQNSYGTAYYIHINSKWVHCEAWYHGTYHGN